MAWSSLLRLVYPDKCALCTRIGAPAVCPDCFSEFAPAPGVEPAPPLERVEALYLFDRRVKQAVLRLKYERATSLIDPLAQLMREAWEDRDFSRYDYAVPVPITRSRRRWRGFNQASELCSALPAVDLTRLTRVRERPPQVGLSRSERIGDWEGVFRSEPWGGEGVLLIDDVATTQSTLVAAAEELRRAGAGPIAALTFAFEP